MNEYAARNDLFEAFPRADAYRERFAVPGMALRERGPGETVFLHSERHLQCVWFDARWRPPLATEEGEALVVDHPGRWNLEAGPDFLDAVLRIGGAGRRIKGDVEVHVRPADWARHAHAADARYRRIAAHVTYHPGPLPPGALPAGAVQVSLRDALAAMPEFSFDNIDVTAYPHAALPPVPPPCAAALAAAGPDAWGALLDSAGEERLRRKARRIAARIEEAGPAQALYEEVLAALGYKQNAAACRTLARRLPLRELAGDANGDPLRAYALLLGKSGLLPETLPAHWPEDARRFARSLWDIWWRTPEASRADRMPGAAWDGASMRPQNAPVRRLAAAATWFVSASALHDRLIAAAAAKGAPAARLAELASVFGGPFAVPFWTRRLAFASPPTAVEIAIVGHARVASMAANVAIPFLAAIGRPVADLAPALPPEQDNAVTRETACALFGRDHNPALWHTGLRQQGLVQVFQDFCLEYRGRCSDCPLTAEPMP